MRVLVTGATGFVGSALAASLCRRGEHVRVLVRPGSDRSNLDGLPVEPIEGDLGAPETLRKCLRDCDCLLHAAADYRLWVPDPATMYRINVEGTRLLMEAALSVGVKRIVYTSSVATLAPDRAGTPVDESARGRLADMIGPYKRSKWQAERLVQEMVRERGLPAVIVNPTAPVGPRDRRPTPTGQMVLDAARGRIPVYLNTGLNIVDVADVADGHLLALDKGRIGQCYILGGENLSLKEIVDTVAERMGLRGPRIRLPYRLVLPMAHVVEAWARLRGCAPPFTVDGVRLAGKHMYFSSDRARRELGYAPRPAAEALARAVDWYQAHGFLD